MPKKPRKPRKSRLEDELLVPDEDEAVVEDVSGDGEQAVKQQVFRPGVDPIEEDEELDYDPSAYTCMHKWALDWPCLSFDILKDGLGGPRTAFPHTGFFVAATQAGIRQQNHIAVMKLANLAESKQGKKSADDDMDSVDSEDEEEDGAEPARLHVRKVAQKSGTNRIRCMHQQPGIVAVSSDTGTVSVLNLRNVVAAVEAEVEPTKQSKNDVAKVKPMHSHKHNTEGFALNWSRTVIGALASGDCGGGMHVWEAQEGGSWAVSGSYGGHGGSVEDIEWSPTEGNVLATACTDKCVRIYDTRQPSSSQIRVEAHASDVNVISWNRLTTYMLASGGDDNCMRIWDLRAYDNYVASLNYHTKPITSIEWCPHESSMLATSSEDDTLMIWDLALERDPEEEAALAPDSAVVDNSAPPQLLFLHAGQKSVKELHWHAQIPGVVVSTAEDSFNLFKPSNV